MHGTLGGAETPEFDWHNNQFVEKWKDHDAHLDYHAAPDVDHFRVVERLASKDSEIFIKVKDWLL